MADSGTSPSTNPNIPGRCAGCAKSTSETVSGMCGGCKSTEYCCRECQNADWENHKSVCGQNYAAEGSTAGPSSRTSQTLKAAFGNQFHALKNKKFLHGRPKEEVFELLVDCYRLRMEDLYDLDIPEADSLFCGAPPHFPGFQRFLRAAERNPGLLPDWWSPEISAECMQEGLATDGWCDLRCTVSKCEMLDHYGDYRLPMQLRILGDQVYGSPPGGKVVQP